MTDQVSHDEQSNPTHIQLPALDSFLLRQDELNRQQLSQAERDQFQRTQTYKRFIDEKLRHWANEEAEQITKCDGGSIKSVREWIRAIKAAQPRVPDDEDDDSYLKKLIAKTSRGDLFDATENFLNKRGRAATTASALLKHILDSFLGPDEQETLKDEVKNIKQGPREEIPAYNRRFRKAAEIAYPDANANEEVQLTNMYLAGMKKGRVQDRLFEHEPRLVSMDEVTSAAHEEWAKLRFKERVLNEAKAAAAIHEPMEVDALTTRETIAEQEKKIKQLQQQLQRNSTQQLTVTSSGQMPRSNPKDGCFWCKKVGHIKRDCPGRQEYWAKKGGEPRPLEPEQRKMGN